LTANALGLGGTAPAAWTFPALQLQQAAFAGSGVFAFMLSNAFYDGAWRYIANGTAAQAIISNSLGLQLRFAGSGTAGSALSWSTEHTFSSNGDYTAVGAIQGSNFAAGASVSGTNTGDQTVFIASGTSHAAGIVPDPGAAAGSTKFLREDATWAVPSGGGGSSGPDFVVSTICGGALM
jgi:hypothetical protein